MIEKIDASMNEAKLHYLFGVLNQVKSQLPFLITLTPEERKKLYRKGENQFTYIRKTVHYAKTNSYHNPKFIDINDLENKLETAERMKMLTDKAGEIYEAINDTTHLLYQELYETSRLLYMNYRMIAKTDNKVMEEVINDLKQHFPRTGKKKNT